MYVMIAMSLLTAGMTLYLGFNVYKLAIKGLFKNRWSTNTLYTISTLTIVVVSILSLFIPGLPLMVEAAPLVLGFWHLGEAIEHSLLNKLNVNLDVRDCLPQKVKLVINNQKEESDVKAIKPKDILFLEAGNVIPVDGVLLEATQIYTTRVDGSPYLKTFQKGEVVKSGMQLPANCKPVTMQATGTYENSYLAQIAENIKKANKNKAPVEQFTAKVLKYFVPGVVAVAVLTGIIVASFFPPALAIQAVVSVLVSACPCALSLITPMAVKIGMKKASEKGVVFKDGKSLQAAASIDAIVFDLNGTLTKGEVRVTQLRVTDKKYLNYLDLLESHSEHALAKRIRQHISSEGLSGAKKLIAKNIDDTHHSGISAFIDGERYAVGNKHFLAHLGITRFSTPFDNPSNGTIYLTRGKEVIGQIAMEDPLRKDAIATVNHLQKLGKQVHICTGADELVAAKYAKKLGIPTSHICANASGVETTDGGNSKTRYVKSLQAKGLKVAMVGDAANDLTAIANADIGVAVKSDIGDNVTQQQAGISIQKGSLFPIVSAFAAAKKTKRNIYTNLAISLGYNSLVIALPLVAVLVGFALNPAVGVALMVIESALVLGSLYRLKRQSVIDAKSTLAANEGEWADKQYLSSSPAKTLSKIAPTVRVTASQDKDDNSTLTFKKQRRRPIYWPDTEKGNSSRDYRVMTKRLMAP
jgi:Cu2+-exporting ATPase